MPNYPMIDEDTLQMNSPFGAITNTVDKALKTYLVFKQANRKAETDIAKSLFEGMLKNESMQMKTDLPPGINPQNVSDVQRMFELKPQEERTLTPEQQIAASREQRAQETHRQERGYEQPVTHTPNESRFPASGVAAYGETPITRRIKGFEQREEERKVEEQERKSKLDERGMKVRERTAITSGKTPKYTDVVKDQIIKKVYKGESLTFGEQTIYNDIIKKSSLLEQLLGGQGGGEDIPGGEASPYPEYPDAFQEKGQWKVMRNGKKYIVQE